MEIGIFSRTFEVSDLEETYKRMIKQGITHTQFNLSNAGISTLPIYLDEKKIEEIGNMTKRYQIQLSALTGTFNMIDPDVQVKKKGCDQFRIQCQIAHMLQIPIVSLCTGSKHPKSKWKWHDDNKKQSSWDDLMRSTEVILRYAKEYDVILGVETEASNIINTPYRARTYLDQVGSKRLKIIMDGANLFRPDQIPDMREIFQEAFAMLGKDIVLAHAKDLCLKNDIEFVAVGEGVLDFPYYIELLRREKYKGPLIMHGLTEQQVSSSKRFLKEILANG